MTKLGSCKWLSYRSDGEDTDVTLIQKKLFQESFEKWDISEGNEHLITKGDQQGSVWLVAGWFTEKVTQ